MKGNFKNYYTYTALDAAGEVAEGEAINVAGAETAVVQITGTFEGTVTFNATADGENFVAVQATGLDDGQAATTAAAAGIYRVDVRGLSQLRPDVTAWTSGSITATVLLTGGW